MLVIVLVTAPPVGSITPSTRIATSLWFGGHSRFGLAVACEQSGGGRLTRTTLVPRVTPPSSSATRTGTVKLPALANVQAALLPAWGPISKTPSSLQSNA